jgi:predicted HTH transcriptional regulator
MYSFFGGILRIDKYDEHLLYRNHSILELKNKIEVDEVELVLPVSAVTTNVVKDVVKDVVKELTDRQQVILGLIKENPSLSASEMSQKTGMVTRTIQRDLASLHEKGILTREGGRKDGKWVIIIENKEAT